MESVVMGIQFFVGGIIVTLIVGWAASKDLIREIRKLRQLNQLILVALQNSGMADLNFDKDGNIVGLNINIQAKTAELKLTAGRVVVDAARNSPDSHPK